MLNRIEEKTEEHEMVQFLSKMDEVPFRIKVKHSEYTIGEGTPVFTVVLKQPIPLSSLMESTSLALGEAYMDGNLDIEGNLYEALRSFMGQMPKFSTDHKALKKLMHTSLSKKTQSEEIQKHYDIGNDFYSLWLDSTLSYSCAYFKNPGDSLYKAQMNKIDYILEKLHLEKGMSLLDIGCGWGFLLIEAAKKYKVRGTGITLSKEQYQKFRERIQNEHLEDFLDVKLLDYRDLPKLGKKFDRVVSVGMLEHVGRENYQRFVDSVSDIMEDGGLFLLHFISGRKEYPGDPWIRKYIFPGGVVPSLREMISALSEDEFHVLDVENLRMHYNKTLLCWDNNFMSQLDKVREKFDERFIRMWHLYLTGCASTFYNGIIDIHQVLVTKGVNNDLPITRWY